MPRKSNQPVKRHLETFLLTGELSDDLESTTLRANRLGAYAYGKTEGVRKALYKADYLAAATRHQVTKRRLLPLLKSWHQAGIMVLLFKGFYQAEFVYDVPAERFYGDVDLLIHPGDVEKAKQIAEQLGWWVTWDRASSSLRQYSNVEFHLNSEDGQLKIEVHRFPTPSYDAYHERQDAIMHHVWANAHKSAWEGLEVKVMHPVDAFLIGLCLNRAWSEWGVKPHDLLDMRALIKRYGVTRQELEARAKGVNCQRTLSIYLQWCNPWEARLELFKASFWQQRKNDFWVSRENQLIAWRRWLNKWLHSVQLLGYVARALPTALQAKYYLSKHTNLSALLCYVDRSKHKRLRTIPGEWTAVTAKWTARLLSPGSSGTCILRSLILYQMEKEAGNRPVFYSGIRRANNALTGHAWVERDNRPVVGFGDERARHLYYVNFCYPQAY